MTQKRLGCGALLLSTRLDPPEDPEVARQLPAEPSILLFQRGFGAPTYGGCLGGPGGIYEKGKDDNPGLAARREVREETGYDFYPESEAYYAGSMHDRDLEYYLGRWIIDDPVKADEESIGKLWANRQMALMLAHRGLLSFHYAQAVHKLVADGYL